MKTLLIQNTKELFKKENAKMPNSENPFDNIVETGKTRRITLGEYMKKKKITKRKRSSQLVDELLEEMEGISENMDEIPIEFVEKWVEDLKNIKKEQFEELKRRIQEWEIID